MPPDERGDRRKGRVLLLGATGSYGRAIARLLTAAPEVTRLIVAGRDLEVARRLAATLGHKASAVHVDLCHPKELSSAAADVDLVVNAAGPERLVVLPALRQAIDAGADYCDLCADARVVIEARLLDDEARKADVTVLLGAGEFPGLSNLTMLRAARALDVAEEVRHCVVYIPAHKAEMPAERLQRWRRTGRVDASWQLIMRSFAPPVSVVRAGRLTAVDPGDEPVAVALPGGAQVTAYPVGFSEPVTLHEALPALPVASALWSFVPSALNERALELGKVVARGELRESEAALDFYERLVSQPAAPAELRGVSASWVLWAEAIGLKDGHRATARCAARGGWATTEGLLCAAALRILRGEITLRGVLSPESCLDPLPYFAEAARLAGVPTAPAELLEESIWALKGRPSAPAPS